ncbi:hypothetical protein LTR95_009686 [Oleoguttula sp. CCFEE 5521]
MAHVLRAPGVPGIALANLKQQRLQVFVLSDKDGQPLRRVPVFAEAALVTRNPYYARQDLLNSGLFGLQALELEAHFAHIRETNEDLFRKLILEISKRVQVYSVSRMMDLAPWRMFISEVLEAISKDDLLTSQTSVPKDSALAAIVDRAATSTGMPPGSPLISIASLPLGCLSTDHVGFASFDFTRLDLSKVFLHESDSRVIRASEFDTIVVAGGSRSLDFASPKPLVMLGNYIAFPRLQSEVATANALAIDSLCASLIDSSEERLISFAVRGLFAEAKLGHCNVADEIDDTRFWRWNEHPLQAVASDIGPAQPVQPQNNPPQATPTAFPTPIVQIQQPLAEPDPQANNLNNARKDTNQASGTQLTHDENTAKIANDAARQSSSRTTPDQAQYAINAAKNQAVQGTISKEQRDQIVAN